MFIVDAEEFSNSNSISILDRVEQMNKEYLQKADYSHSLPTLTYNNFWLW